METQNIVIAVSIITSCIWLVAIIAGLMYRHLKKMVEGAYAKVNQTSSDLQRSIDEVYQYVDSRYDKSVNAVKKNKD